MKEPLMVERLSDHSMVPGGGLEPPRPDGLAVFQRFPMKVRVLFMYGV
jgi:hypothetical protein